jgi:N-acetylglucosamine-6-phosphate deacetylase
MVISFVARRYDTRETVRVRIDRGIIHSLDNTAARSDQGSDPPWLAPGLIDLQVNGYGGVSFNSPALSLEQVERVSLAMDAHGLTGFCATITTDRWEILSHSMATVGRAIRTLPAVGERILGIHLEGPYICPDDGPRGAHPAQYVRPPDWDEFQRLQEVADGQIRMITLSPEYDTAPDFIRQAVAQGILVAIGHTKANGRQICDAVDAGARLSTHLGNGAHRQLARHPNYIWDQLAEDRLVASLIVDGHHLPPSVVKTFLRAKTPSRCILISDITSMAGLPPGRYNSDNSGDIEILEDGKMVIAGQRDLLAGAALPITAGLANVLRYTEYDLRDAIEMATLGPARLLGCAAGQLDIGAPANLTLLRLPFSTDRTSVGAVEVVSVIRGGQLVWGQLPDA